MSNWGVRVGELRPSQLLWSFGVGAIVDLPSMSVVVAGLDEWQEANATMVPEARLVAGVRRVLGPQVERLLSPPIPPPSVGPFNPFSEEAKTGVPVIPFPRYLRCPICQTLAPFDSGLFDLKTDQYRADRTRYVHGNCNKAKGAPPTAVPARFLVACRRGHLDDFPWRFFVHRGPTQCTGTLRFFEQGASLETRDLFVACGAKDTPVRSMAEAFGEDGEGALPKCRGSHPHLREYEGCDQPLRAILLGASNSWFAATMSALAVPTDADELEQMVGDNWKALESIDSLDKVAPAVGAAQAYGQLLKLKKHDDAEIFAAIEQHRAMEAGDLEVGPPDFHGPEWEAFTAPSPAKTDEFMLRTVDVPERYAERVAQVRVAERLREVNALIGFSRVEPPAQTRRGETPVARAPLSRKPPKWVPATEVRGEGIFLRFDEDNMAAWNAQHGIYVRSEFLDHGQQAWFAARRLESPPFIGARYIMLHTFAHLMLREFSLECGYGAASIRERIYADEGQAGVLLYTAAPDSEGTLGGLVALGEPESLQPLIDSALTRAASCASDPLCTEHDPGRDRSLHGAACHACLFVPETSCEMGNKYLDRSLVVPTFGDQVPAFFDLALS